MTKKNNPHFMENPEISDIIGNSSFPSSCLGVPINKALSKLTPPSRSLGAR